MSLLPTGNQAAAQPQTPQTHYRTTYSTNQLHTHEHNRTALLPAQARTAAHPLAGMPTGAPTRVPAGVTVH